MKVRSDVCFDKQGSPDSVIFQIGIGGAKNVSFIDGGGDTTNFEVIDGKVRYSDKKDCDIVIDMREIVKDQKIDDNIMQSMLSVEVGVLDDETIIIIYSKE